MIIVPTIRHTGSHFVLNLLRVEHPWRPEVLAWRGAERAQEGSIIFDHVLPHQKHLFLPLIEEHTTIVPLRHPKLTAKSWEDRGRELGDLVSMWSVMVQDIDPLEPNYLPLDVPDRSWWLEGVKDATGLPLETDWSPQGSRHGNAELRHYDVVACPEINRLCERIQPFLDRFYD